MKQVEEHKLVVADGILKQQVISMLKQNDLPVSDIDESKILFALLEDDGLTGTGGLEVFDDCALLRSISVKKNYQGKGLGKFITRELERICAEKEIFILYLLTTTAKDFFIKEGYQVIDRSGAPPSIKKTSEFSTVCSSSAILMKKNIS
ncbi:MAG TPA: arsenic resistance N-acetyltransferase ArsN2 [Chitinophagaceae bacterium]|nr:arsenic resistance N-acetyltransferase ArsN2 [Chitinophagaceae bacterium]